MTTDASAPRARLLVVDDEPLIGSVLKRMFGKTHEVEVLSDGNAALARVLADEGFDVILCDVMMPGLNGPAFVRALRERRPDLAARVIFLTGGAFSDDVRADMEGLSQPVVDKPFDQAQLRALVAARTTTTTTTTTTTNPGA